MAEPEPLKDRNSIPPGCQLLVGCLTGGCAMSVILIAIGVWSVTWAVSTLMASL